MIVYAADRIIVPCLGATAGNLPADRPAERIIPVGDRMGTGAHADGREAFLRDVRQTRQHRTAAQELVSLELFGERLTGNISSP